MVQMVVPPEVALEAETDIRTNRQVSKRGRPEIRSSLTQKLNSYTVASQWEKL